MQVDALCYCDSDMSVVCQLVRCSRKDSTAVTADSTTRLPTGATRVISVPQEDSPGLQLRAAAGTAPRWQQQMVALGATWPVVITPAETITL